MNEGKKIDKRGGKMKSLKLTEDHQPAEWVEIEGKKPLSFTARQFQLEPTRRQQKFDWTFGVVLPLICVAADPIVFYNRLGFERAVLGEYKTFAYVLSAVSILSMAAWLLWGQRLGELRGYLAGLFLAASAVSFMVGLAILPWSLLGSLVLIGLLGFTPFFSSFVFLRNSVRAIDGATSESAAGFVIRAAILTALYSLIVPFVLNF